MSKSSDIHRKRIPRNPTNSSSEDDSAKRERIESKQSDAVTKYLFIFLGAGILAFGMSNVHARCDISEGGVLGLSLLAYYWLNIPPNLSSLILDGSCFLIGALILRKGFLFDSVLASFLYSSWYQLFIYLGPLLPDLSGSLWLAAILGGIFVGFGAGFIVRFGCAAGGDDSLALIFNEKTGIRVSVFYVISDFVILICSLSYIPFRSIIWSFATVLISSFIIEMLRPKTADNI